MGGLRLLVLAGLLLIRVSIPTNQVLGSTRYVSHSGNNTPPYTTWETAAYTIATVAAEIQPGETVRIAAGVYVEPSELLLNNGVSLIGAGADSTEIRHTGTPTYQIRADHGNLLVSALRFSAVSGSPYPTAVLYQSQNDSLWIVNCRFESYEHAIHSVAAYLEVQNCQFIDCARASTMDIIYVGIGSGNGLIHNCTFVNDRLGYNWQSSIYMFFYGFGQGNFTIANNIFSGYQEAIYATLSNGLITIENNLFVNDVLPEQESPTIATPYVFLGTPQVVVRNNLFEGNYTEEVVGEDMTCLDIRSFGSADIYNNVFLGNQIGVRVRHDGAYGSYPPVAFTIDHNSFWLDTRVPQVVFTTNNFVPFDSFYCEEYFQETDTTVSIIADNLCRDPMFTDTIDYFLQAGSPCIDAGRPDIFDLDGSRSDIGPFGGSAGEFYSYQDFPPVTPVAFNGAAKSSAAMLQWQRNSESDLWYYILYKSTEASLFLDSNHVLAYLLQDTDTLLRNSPDDSSWLSWKDTTFVPAVGARYTIVAVDSSGLISMPAPEVYFVGTDVHEGSDLPLPHAIVLEQNYPNPFNATTAIVYSLPNIGAQPAPVTLVIYNTLGQEVRTLVRQNQYPGRQVTYWDGHDKFGKEVASGIYFYKLRVSGIDLIMSRKMVLLK